MSIFFQWDNGNLVVTNWGLIGLLCLPGFIYGLRRGWQEEGFTAVGLGIAVTSLGDEFIKILILMANGVVRVFPIAVALILGQEMPNPSAELIPSNNPWAQLVAFVLIVLVTYRAGTILGRRKGMGPLGRFTGGIFGIMNVVLILARVFELINPLPKDLPVNPPTVTILGLRSDLLKGIVVGIIGLIIALFLLLAWFNRRRARD